MKIVQLNQPTQDKRIKALMMISTMLLLVGLQGTNMEVMEGRALIIMNYSILKHNLLEVEKTIALLRSSGQTQN